MLVMYQIIDAGYVYHSFLRSDLTGLYHLQIEKVHICFYTWRLQGDLLKTLQISQKKLQIVKVYDGPHTLCEEMDSSKQTLVSSTFQVLITMIQNCTIQEFSVNFTQVQAQMHTHIVDNHTQSDFKSFSCPEPRHKATEHCVLHLQTQRNVYAEMTISVSFTGFLTFDCWYGAFAAFTKSKNTTVKILQMCVSTWRPQTFVSSTNSVLLTKFSYQFLSSVNISYSVRESRCEGVFLNPTCALRGTIFSNAKYTFHNVRCDGTYAPYKSIITYRLQPGYCINIYMSPLRSTETFFGHIHLRLDSKVSQGYILNVYKVRGLASLENLRGIDVFEESKIIKRKYIYRLRGKRAEVHWNYSVAHFYQKKFYEVHCIFSAPPKAMFGQSFALVEVSYKQYLVNESEEQDIFQKARSFVIKPQSNIPPFLTFISVPVEKFHSNILGISAVVDPKFVGVFVVKSKTNQFERDSVCGNHGQEFPLLSSVQFSFHASMRYFLTRRKLLISTPGNFPAEELKVNITNSLSSITLHSENSIAGVPLVDTLIPQELHPTILKISRTIRGYALNVAGGQYVFFRSGSTFLSWMEGQMACQCMKQSMVEFHTLSKLNHFLLMVKQTQKIPPLRAVFIGIRKKVFSSLEPWVQFVLFFFRNL